MATKKLRRGLRHSKKLRGGMLSFFSSSAPDANLKTNPTIQTNPTIEQLNTRINELNTKINEILERLSKLEAKN
jgi:hypothetical protein